VFFSRHNLQGSNSGVFTVKSGVVFLSPPFQGGVYEQFYGLVQRYRVSISAKSAKDRCVITRGAPTLFKVRKFDHGATRVATANGSRTNWDAYFCERECREGLGI
jgi:hypothetical protein